MQALAAQIDSTARPPRRAGKPEAGSQPRLLNWLDRLVDWFIPAEIAAERDTRQRARMFLISHLLGPFIGNVVPGALFFLDPHPGFAVAVLAISITSFWAFPVLLRTFGHYNLLALVSVQNLMFCILWSCYFYGGVSSPTVPWVLTIPLLAFFYLGSDRNLRLAVFGLAAANLAGFFALSVWGPKIVLDVPSQSLQLLGIVSTIAASIYVTMMAVYYAKILASGVELEGEMREHLATARQLRKATAEAERAGLAKSEFVARMSHELRTPLNAVIGYSEMLLENAADTDDPDAEDLGKIHTAGKHLLRLVSEVLDLSKIEAGKMNLMADKVEVAPFMSEVVEGCQAAAARGKNSLTLELAPGLGAMECDAHKVRRVLVEMINNAAKFTENGRIVVEVSRTRGEDQERVVVKTRDTGCGIAPEALPDLFERFSVGSDASSSKYGGTGLGLALNLELCRLMGGDISVESQLGVGSCFTVTLPVHPPRRQAPVDDPAAADGSDDEAGAAASDEDGDLINLGPINAAA